MKKIFLVGAMLLLAAGCQTKTVSDAAQNNDRPIQTLPEAIDNSNKGDTPACTRTQNPKSGVTIYRNEDLGFEFKQGKLIFDSKQSNSSQAVFNEANALVSGGENVYAGSVAVEATTMDTAALKVKLQQDGSVDNIREILVDCEHAFGYVSEGGVQPITQVQLIHGGKLFTIDGTLAEPDVLATFKFLDK